MPVKEAKSLIDAWYMENFEYKIWKAETIAFANKYGYVTNPFGRRRWIRGCGSSDNYTRVHAENQAVNTPIQGGAADVCAEGFYRALMFLRERKLQTRASLQIHDAVLFDIPNDEELAIVQKNIPGLMEIEYDWMRGIPLCVDTKVGKTWGDLEESGVGVSAAISDTDGA